MPTVAMITLTEIRHREGTLEGWKCLKKFLCLMNEMLVLSDHELGETDLVEHQINLDRSFYSISTEVAIYS